uniref:Integrase, catalytic region, zinc finger, CCHC-type, peptidase aspartic, catalytic n=1 Tax=Tanacetum cinerariifolium TaxID=118510 RepID=A0A6L2LUG0_TANCI|nr:integrase, catalytic region, zinc finger, CCHC-type, peptidase aspartic, catalytic [Tanacetum cinerariifolium]
MISEFNPQHQLHYLLKILHPVSISQLHQMSNTNNNMQTQTSNTLHNAIMEAGSKDRPPMLAPGNYVQWKSRIKRYSNTKPNHELIHYCLESPPYELGWKDKEVPSSEGSSITRTERVNETYKNVSQEIRDQLNAKAEALKTVSYHKLYDILKQHQHEVNEIRAEKIARVANPLALVAQQQPVYHPQNHPTRYTQNSSTRSQQAVTRNRGKAIFNSPQPIYDQELSMVAEDDETNVGYENQRIGNVVGARETVGSTVELEAHYMYMAQLQEVSPNAADSGPIFDAEPLQKVSNDDHYNVFAIESEHTEQSESVHDTYPIEQDTQNVIIDSLDMNYHREEIDQNDDDNDLAKERELLASLINKLKCEIDESKNRNKFLETSNKDLIEKLKGEIEDFKNKNISLESSNNFFKEANNRLSKTNNLLYADYKKLEADLARRDSKEYASQMELECAKVRGDLLSYKMDYQKSCTKYTDTINDLNQTISEMKDKLSAHQETISILSKQKEAQIKLYKTREDKELEKLIELENKVKVLDNIVYKTGQIVQTMNMLNNKCRTSFPKPEFLKKAQSANPRLYDIGCYNDNLALMLAPDTDEVIRLEKESRSKLSDLIRPFDYDKLNNLYDLFIPQCEKSSEQRYFSERSRLSHTNVHNGKSKESFHKQTTLLEKRMDESIQLDKQYEVTNLQCDYLELLEKSEGLETELSKSKMMSKSFESVKKHAINLELELQQYKEKIKNDMLFKLVEIVLFIVDSGCSKHMMGNLKLLTNFVEKFLGTMKFRNDQTAPILGYGDLVQGAIMIKRVYYVEGLNHNLFSVDQFCDVDLEVAFRTSTCYIRDLKRNDLLTDHNQTRASQLPQDSRKTNKRVSFSTRVILTTSVSRPQLKRNPMGDRAMRNNSQGKKQEVEDQRRNVKLPKNKTSVTACNDSLNAKTLNVKYVSAMCDKCMLHDKHDMCVLTSVAKPLKKTVALESNQKPRNITKKLYKRFSKTSSWWYSKFTPSGYKWKPKSRKENVNLNVSMSLGNASRTTNVMDTMTSMRSIVSNTPLSSNSVAARRDCPIHLRLWVLKAHDKKSQASN